MKNHKDLFIGALVIALLCGGVFFYNTRAVSNVRLSKEEVTEKARIAFAPIVAKEKAKIEAEGAMERLSNLLIAKSVEKKARETDKAIRAGKVIAYMSVYEVLLAKGHPRKILDGSKIDDDWRKEGVVEVWHYGPEAFLVPAIEDRPAKLIEPDYVAFNADGLVVWATDIH